jgi:hypothetical protein
MDMGFLKSGNKSLLQYPLAGTATLFMYQGLSINGEQVKCGCRYDILKKSYLFVTIVVTVYDCSASLFIDVQGVNN